jgi:hypothetical protein
VVPPNIAGAIADLISVGPKIDEAIAWKILLAICESLESCTISSFSSSVICREAAISP